MSKAFSWDDVRDDYVAGNEVIVAGGATVIEAYSLDDLALKYDLNYSTLVKKCKTDGWDLLKAGFEAMPIIESARAANAAQRLLSIAKAYIDLKYQPIIDIADNPNRSIASLSEEEEQFMSDPSFLDGLNKSAVLVEKLHKLQLSIAAQAAPSSSPGPKGRPNVSAAAMSMEEKQSKLAALEAEMGFSFGIALQ
jgi:hypothetical protein